MDFFEHQEQARKQTGRLVFFFSLAVLGIILTAYGILLFFLGHAITPPGSTLHEPMQELWQPGLLTTVTLFTLMVVGTGTLYKVVQLQGGGHVVAESLNGRLVQPGTQDPKLRQLLNVVEEMAIASGVPTPPVYLMEEEQGINAFAAGYATEDAVIGITRGAVDQFTREELQGVIAHEFSHILNGDMRLNIRLMGVIHGILLLGILGYTVMRFSAISSSGRSRGAGVIIIMGMSLWLLGSLGTFFGRLIQAAVSRQREFLADASAVQFTRNPDGIGNALKRIAGYSQGSRMEHPNASECSHMFFGAGLKAGFFNWYATHPPIDQRIRRIDPAWHPELADKPRVVPTAIPEAAGFAAGPVEVEAAVSRPSALKPIGQPSPAHLAYAQKLIASLPDALHAAAQEPYGARALVYGLLLCPDLGVRKNQLDRLARHSDHGVYQETQRLMSSLEQLMVEARLPLIDLAIPALRLLTAEQYSAFRENVEVLVQADQRVSLFEWTLQRIILRHLDPQYRYGKPRKAKYKEFAPVKREIELLIGSLAYLGHPRAVEAQQAYYQAVQSLGFVPGKIPDPQLLGFGLLDGALDKLDALLPLKKREFLQACEFCVWHNNEVNREEGEMVRAISDALGCPMPPLLPGQTRP